VRRPNKAILTVDLRRIDLELLKVHDAFHLLTVERARRKHLDSHYRYGFNGQIGLRRYESVQPRFTSIRIDDQIDGLSKVEKFKTGSCLQL
jgi:hypothetical protein